MTAEARTTTDETATTTEAAATTTEAAAAMTEAAAEATATTEAAAAATAVQLVGRLAAQLQGVQLCADAVRLLDLPTELQRQVALHVHADDVFALRLTCTALAAVGLTEGTTYTSTALVPRAGGCSSTRLRWALEGWPELFARQYWCMYSASAGRLDMLRWAREHGCPWDEETLNAAAAGGHVEVLSWAHEHGCPSSSDACLEAARGGHLSALKELRARGVDWTDSVLCLAATNGHVDVLRWALDHDCPRPSRLSTLCEAAASGCHLEVLQWLHANGCPWDEHTLDFCCDRTLIEWAREHGCPVPSFFDQ